jgi:tetratricopeptide (TPR) repeat protein
VLKALEKNPADRYATAKELAEDLRRFLEDEPIHARRPTVLQRASKWARRHPAAVRATSAALLIVLAVLGATAGWWLRDRASRQRDTERAVTAALEEAQRLQAESKLPEALGMAQRAEAVLAAGTATPALTRRVQERLADLQLVLDLEEVRFQRERFWEEPLTQVAEDYAQTFRNVGIDLDALSPDDAAGRLRQCSVAAELAAALDNWSDAAKRSAPATEARVTRLVALAQAADPDPVRCQLRQARAGGDVKTLAGLAASVSVDDLPPATALRIAMALEDSDPSAAETLLRQAQRRYPADFWINWELGAFLCNHRKDYDGSIRFLTAALAIRPQSAQVHTSLGAALQGKGQVDEALAAHRAAIHLRPNSAMAHANLGAVLCDDKHDYDGAIAAFREAVRLRPNFAAAHDDLGKALSKKGRVDEAIAAYRDALRIRPDRAETHYDLGNAFLEKKQMDNAIAEFQAAIKLKRDYSNAHTNLGIALQEKGQVDDAIAEYRKVIQLIPESAYATSSPGIDARGNGPTPEAIAEYKEMLKQKPDWAITNSRLGSLLCDRKRDYTAAIAAFWKANQLDPNNPYAHSNLGNALHHNGQMDAAIAAYRRAIEVKPDFADAYLGLGAARFDQGQVDEAITAYRKAIEVAPDLAEAHCNLAQALQVQGKFEEALAAFRRGHELGMKDPSWRYPSAQWVRDAERPAELDRKLPALLRGEIAPVNAKERFEFGEHCYRKRLYGAGVRLLRDALAAQPALANDLQSAYRYNAACCAALAGCGKGQDAAQLDDAARTRWRQQALDWLRADLTLWHKQLDGDKPSDVRAKAQNMLRHWQQDGDLAGLRDEPAVAKLPEPEQQAWRQFWSEVQGLLDRAKGSPRAASAPKP